MTLPLPIRDPGESADQAFNVPLEPDIFDSVHGIATAQIRALTPARIFQRRSGTSLATSELLSFQLDLGRARDAVQAALQPASFLPELNRALSGRASAVLLHSAARDRREYLQRPDLGRVLDAASAGVLQQRARSIAPAVDRSSLAIVIADGLSALGVERNACPLVAALLPLLPADAWQLQPVCVVEQGRVAVGDEIGQLLRADMLLMLIGERPGLSSPDSLGAYITWKPLLGRNDAERNCISNIRAGGLVPELAAMRIAALMQEATRLQLTGVALKESSLPLEAGQ